MQEAVIPLGLGNSVRLVFSKESLTPQEWDQFTKILGLMRVGLVERESVETPVGTEEQASPQITAPAGGPKIDILPGILNMVELKSTELSAKLPDDFNGPKEETAYVVREYVKVELLKGIPAALVAKESKKKFLKQGVGYYTVCEWRKQWKKEGLKFPTAYNQRPGYRVPEEIREYAEECFKDGTSPSQISRWIEAKWGQGAIHFTTVYGWKQAWKKKQKAIVKLPLQKEAAIEFDQLNDLQQISPSRVKPDKVTYESEVYAFVKGRLLNNFFPEQIAKDLLDKFPSGTPVPPLGVILIWRERLRAAGEIKRLP